MCGRSVCAGSDLKLTPVTQIPRNVWKSFFVFTVVRNPWLRLASSYTFLHRRFLHTRTSRTALEPGDRCGMAFDAFTRDTHGLVDLCRTELCCALLSSGAFKSAPAWDGRFVSQHLAEQSHLAFAPSGAAVVDYIGRTEHLDADWAEIVATVNSLAGTSFVARPVGIRNHLAIGRGSACEDGFYSQLYANATLLGNVAMQYAMDVHRFGFLR